MKIRCDVTALRQVIAVVAAVLICLPAQGETIHEERSIYRDITA